MKILLLGDFSSVHNVLKEGLIELGHEVILVSNGDGYRNIIRDIDIANKYSGRFGSAELIFRLYRIIPKLKNFDVVQLMSPILFPTKFDTNKTLITKLIKNNRSSFLIGAGMHTNEVADFYIQKYKYPQLFHEIKKTLGNVIWFQTPKGIDYNQYLLGKINGYIPIMYEYAQGYRDISYKKLCPTIPLPVNTDKIEYKENLVGSHLIIFHGISRMGVKGTPIIRKAMENIKTRYPNDVEIILEGNMSLDRYLNVIRKANIVIDQTYSVSYGVNAALNMAMGKVVLGGGEPECLQEFGVKFSPMIPIQPTVEDIEEKLIFLIENKHKIPEIGYQSRKYVDAIHDYKKVAQKYIEIWLSNR